MDRLVGHLRQQVHAVLFRSITAELDPEQAARLDVLLEVRSGESVSAIARLKESPGPATLKHIRDWTQHLGRRVRRILEVRGGVDTLGAHIEPISACHGNNYLPLLWRAHKTHRSLLLRLLELLGIASATRDNALLDAWHYLLHHRNSRRSTLPCEIDLGFLSQGGSAFVRAKDRDAPALDRRALEVCIFTHIAEFMIADIGQILLPFYETSMKE